MRFKNFLFVVLLLVANECFATTNFFSVESISFLGTTYNLVWSAKAQKNVKIEDFIPKGPSYTQFEKKISISYMPNASFERVFMEKQDELVAGKEAGNILNFKNQVLNNNELMCNYTSELSQDGVSLVVQFSAFRFIRKGTDVIVVEWQYRSYKNADSFKALIDKNKDKWLDAFVKFDTSLFKFE